MKLQVTVSTLLSSCRSIHNAVIQAKRKGAMHHLHLSEIDALYEDLFQKFDDARHDILPFRQYKLVYRVASKCVNELNAYRRSIYGSTKY